MGCGGDGQDGVQIMQGLDWLVSEQKNPISERLFPSLTLSLVFLGPVQSLESKCFVCPLKQQAGTIQRLSSNGLSRDSSLDQGEVLEDPLSVCGLSLVSCLFTPGHRYCRRRRCSSCPPQAPTKRWQEEKFSLSPYPFSQGWHVLPPETEVKCEVKVST